MTKNNLTKKVLNAAKKAVVAGALAVASYAPLKAQASNDFDKNTTFRAASASGVMDTLQLVYAHGRPFFVQEGEKGEPILWDANYVNVLNTFRQNGTNTTDIEPLVAYTPEKVVYEDNNSTKLTEGKVPAYTQDEFADAIVLKKDGKFAKVGKTVRETIGNTELDEQGSTWEITGNDYSGDYKTIDILGEENFYPYWSNSDASGKTLPFLTMYLDGAQEAIDYNGNSVLRRQNSVNKWTFDEELSRISDSTLIKEAANIDYPANVELSNPTTGEADLFLEVKYLESPKDIKQSKDKKDTCSLRSLCIKPGLSAGTEVDHNGFAYATGSFDLYSGNLRVSPTFKYKYSGNTLDSKLTNVNDVSTEHIFGNTYLQTSNSTTEERSVDVPMKGVLEVGYNLGKVEIYANGGVAQSNTTGRDFGTTEVNYVDADGNTLPGTFDITLDNERPINKTAIVPTGEVGINYNLNKNVSIGVAGGYTQPTVSGNNGFYGAAGIKVKIKAK